MSLRRNRGLASGGMWLGIGRRRLRRGLIRRCHWLFVLGSSFAFRQTRRRQGRGRYSDWRLLLRFIDRRLCACRANDQLDRVASLTLSLLNRLQGDFNCILVCFREWSYPPSFCIGSSCIGHTLIRLPSNPRSFVIHFRGFAIAIEFVNVAQVV